MLRLVNENIVVVFILAAFVVLKILFEVWNLAEDALAKRHERIERKRKGKKKPK